jgi:hypothetical protein
MSIFAVPVKGGPGIDDELFALAKIESFSNNLRLRIAGLAPDQFFRSLTDDLPLADLLALAVDRERAFGVAFRHGIAEHSPRLDEPPVARSLLDHEIAEDLAQLYDLRRATLDMLRSMSEAQWQRQVTLPEGTTITLEDLALRLQWYDAHLLRAASQQRRAFIKETGVSDLRDTGVAGKLGANIGQ